MCLRYGRKLEPIWTPLIAATIWGKFMVMFFYKSVIFDLKKPARFDFNYKGQYHGRI